MLDYAGPCRGVLWDGVELCVAFLKFGGSRSRNRDQMDAGLLHGSR